MNDYSTWTVAELRARARQLSLAETLGDISRAAERTAILRELDSRPIRTVRRVRRVR